MAYMYAILLGLTIGLLAAIGMINTECSRYVEPTKFENGGTFTHRGILYVISVADASKVKK